MLKRFAAALGVALGIALPAAAADAEMSKKVVSDAVEKVILPAYSAFTGETQRMSESLNGFCKAPNADGLRRAREQFGAAASGWSQAEMFRFGPAMEDNRLERILFWPDRKSTGLKQVQEVLTTQDVSVTDAGTLARKSVALQGLGALEFVLFGTGSAALATGDQFRCDYASAIAANLHQRAKDIGTDWLAGFATVWEQPRQENPLYRTPDESLTEVLNVLIHGLEMVRDVRLGGFLGKERKDDRPKLAIYWRSEQTVASLRGNLDALKMTFERSGLERMLPEPNRWIAQSVRFEFDNAERALTGLDGPIDALLADPVKRAKLDYAVIVTSSLTDLIANRLTAELGLTAGFSSLDGD